MNITAIEKNTPSASLLLTKYLYEPLSILEGAYTKHFSFDSPITSNVIHFSKTGWLLQPKNRRSSIIVPWNEADELINRVISIYNPVPDTIRLTYPASPSGTKDAKKISLFNTGNLKSVLEFPTWENLGNALLDTTIALTPYTKEKPLDRSNLLGDLNQVNPSDVLWYGYMPVCIASQFTQFGGNPNPNVDKEEQNIKQLGKFTKFHDRIVGKSMLRLISETKNDCSQIPVEKFKDSEILPSIPKEDTNSCIKVYKTNIYYIHENAHTCMIELIRAVLTLYDAIFWDEEKPNCFYKKPILGKDSLCFPWYIDLRD
jgi:hypothetical protein